LAGGSGGGTLSAESATAFGREAVGPQALVKPLAGVSDATRT
jgi:hypothetical protein